MTRCRKDDSLERMVSDGMSFPLGVYPVEDISPRQGYTMEFEPSDGDSEGGDWEEWPDRYAFDIVITSERLESLCRQLFAMLPGRVFPILDFIGHDAYREIDPYIAYELVGQDRLLDAIRRYRDFLLEDGMVGFGALSDEPFIYVFVDEHKIVTVRVTPDHKARVEKILAAFDLEETSEPRGADASAHEHRSVLLAPPDRPELLSGEEIVERLRDDWRLVLNIDAEQNLDDDGNELGQTDWRCLVRCASEKEPGERYLEVLLRASSLSEAEEVASEVASGRVDRESAGSWVDLIIIACDRMRPEQARDHLQATGGGSEAIPEHGVLGVRWL